MDLEWLWLSAYNTLEFVSYLTYPQYGQADFLHQSQNPQQTLQVLEQLPSEELQIILY